MTKTVKTAQKTGKQSQSNTVLSIFPTVNSNYWMFRCAIYMYIYDSYMHMHMYTYIHVGRNT